jgi:uncharacterized protein YecE (DUF72 family)
MKGAGPQQSSKPGTWHLKLWISTSGYSFPDWVGSFYPAGTKSDGMLPYYARHFPAVEINSSFYRPPTVPQVEKMCRKVPAGFAFALKVPRSASHEYDDADLPAFRLAAERVAAERVLLGLLVQVAESFKNLPSNREWLLRVVGHLRPLPVVVEFRHRSWDVPELTEWAARGGFDVVSVAVPDLPQLFPPGLRVAGPRVYGRLHSQNAANWYAGGPARYDYLFPDEALREWADGLTRAASSGVERAAVFFNNCVGTQAVGSAKKLMSLLHGAAGVEVAEPPRPAGERSLFDEVTEDPQS